MTTVIFIHGTAVDQEMYNGTLEAIRQEFERLRADVKVAECFWGDRGVKLNETFVSIPTPASKSNATPALVIEDEQISLWERLYIDPLCELKVLSDRETSEDSELEEDAGDVLYSRLYSLQLKPEQAKLLVEAGIAEFFDKAKETVISSNDYNQALKKAPKLSSDYYLAVARAIVAQAMLNGLKQNKYIKIRNNSKLRDQVVKLLALSLGNEELGIGGWAWKRLLLLGTFVAMPYRSNITKAILAIPDDILLYQTRGKRIRQLIQDKIAEAEAPVVLLTHSLGGVASIDLLVEQNLEKVDMLVTVGSQAPILYEINCLYSLEHGEQLPTHFPKWLNIYDSRDFLSYVGAAVFPSKVEDVEVNNKQPFPQSHDAYWENQETWQAIIERLP